MIQEKKTFLDSILRDIVIALRIYTLVPFLQIFGNVFLGRDLQIKNGTPQAFYCQDYPLVNSNIIFCLCSFIRFYRASCCDLLLLHQTLSTLFFAGWQIMKSLTKCLAAI